MEFEALKDANQLNSEDRQWAAFMKWRAKARRILIAHHYDPDDLPDIEDQQPYSLLPGAVEKKYSEREYQEARREAALLALREADHIQQDIFSPYVEQLHNMFYLIVGIDIAATGYTPNKLREFLSGQHGNDHDEEHRGLTLDKQLTNELLELKQRAKKARLTIDWTEIDAQVYARIDAISDVLAEVKEGPAKLMTTAEMFGGPLIQELSTKYSQVPRGGHPNKQRDASAEIVRRIANLLEEDPGLAKYPDTVYERIISKYIELASRDSLRGAAGETFLNMQAWKQTSRNKNMRRYIGLALKLLDK